MAEQLTNEFTVNRPIEEAWPIITDVERIAPCLPGAQLQEVEGDTYRGVVKVKLGPISSQFKGDARIVEQDDDQHRAVLKASGRDTQGRGNASAEITAQAESLSPTSTRCVVTTDLHITGKVAQFGRGILGDVSSKLMADFATNLNSMLDEQGLEEGGEEAAAPERRRRRHPHRRQVPPCARRPRVGHRRRPGRRLGPPSAPGHAHRGTGPGRRHTRGHRRAGRPASGTRRRERR